MERLEELQKSLERYYDTVYIDLKSYTIHCKKLFRYHKHSTDVVLDECRASSGELDTPQVPTLVLCFYDYTFTITHALDGSLNNIYEYLVRSYYEYRAAWLSRCRVEVY